MIVKVRDPNSKVNYIEKRKIDLTDQDQDVKQFTDLNYMVKENLRQSLYSQPSSSAKRIST